MNSSDSDIDDEEEVETPPAETVSRPKPKIPVLGRMDATQVAISAGAIDERLAKKFLPKEKHTSDREDDDGDSTVNPLAIDPSKIRTDKATICSCLLDDSGSMEVHRHEQINSYNAALTALKEAKSRHEILIGALCISGKFIRNFTIARESKRLSESEFRTDYGSTPLHARISKLAANVLSTQGALLRESIPSRLVTLFMTDGADTDRSDEKFDAAKAAIRYLLKARSSRIFAISFGEGAKAEYLRLGIPASCIREPGSEKELKEIFLEFSQASSAG